MVVRLLRFPLVAAVLFVALAVWAAQPPDPADDPLPKGAKVRFGVTRPILRTGPGVAMLPGYTNFLAPTMNGGIRRYDLGTGRPLDKRGIVGPGFVVVSADGKRAAVARPGALTVCEVASGKELLAVIPPDGVIIVGTPGVSLSGDGKTMAYAVRGQEGRGEVVVCDVDKNEVIAQVETDQLAPVFPLLSRDAKTVVTHGPPIPAPSVDPKPKQPKKMTGENLDALRTAQVWEVATGKELFKARVTGMGGIVAAAALSVNGELLAISSGDGPIDLYDVRTGKRTQTLLGRKAQGVRVAIAPDGKTVASVGPDYRIQRWSSDGTPIDISERPPGVLVAQVTGLEFADNERAVAWVTAAQFCCAWEAPNTRLLSPAMDHCASIRSIAYPKEAKDAMTSGFDGRVFRWDWVTGALNEEIHVRPAFIPGQPLIRPTVDLSADGVRASWLRAPIEIFDMANGSDLFSIPQPSTPPAPVTMNVSPDGLKLITVSRQAPNKRTGSCVVWDLMTQQRVTEFDVPATSSAQAPLAVLSPDESRLILLSAARAPDGGQSLVITGFDTKTGKKLAEVEDPTNAGNYTVSFVAADNNSVVLATTTGRVWSIDYVKGRVDADIEKILAQGDPPISGPIVFSPDGKRFATGVVAEPYTTYGVRVYDWPQRKVLHTFIGHLGPISALRFTPDGQYLASGAQDTSVIVWDLSKMDAR